MHSSARLSLVLLLLSGAALQPLPAQGRSPNKSQNKTQSSPTVSVSVVFRSSDQVTFRNYVATHRIVAQALPPGIAKNVARGKPLPPGIAKRAVPADLIVLGPKLAPDVTLAIVGPLVVALRSGVVIDILKDIF